MHRQHGSYRAAIMEPLGLIWIHSRASPLLKMKRKPIHFQMLSHIVTIDYL